MKTIFLAAVAALALGAGAVSAPAATYHAPAQNYHQNNWMGGD